MIELKAKERKVEEKNDNSSVILAVLYGPKIENKSLSVDRKEFSSVLSRAGESSVINLVLDKEKHAVLIKDYQTNPLTDEIVHIDFYQPILTEKVEAAVSVVLFGEAPVAKESSGIVVQSLSEIEVSALPTKLPHVIEVDISNLKEFEDNIFVKDLIIPKDVSVLTPMDEVVVSVSAPRLEKEEEEVEETAEMKDQEEDTSSEENS